MHMFESVGFSGAGLASPLFLLIVDYDTRRFSLEDPLSLIAVWDKEVGRMRRSGRNVRCFKMTENEAKTAADRLQSFEYDEWPPRSIVDLPVDVG